LRALPPVWLPTAWTPHLPPSCPPSLHAHYRRFRATMEALTPDSVFAALRLPRSMNTALCPPSRAPCFTCTAFRPFRLHPPDSPRRRFRTLPLSATGFRRLSRRSGLRPWVAGSSVCPAVSSSLAYGLVIHLPLLRTPPRGDALSFGYRPESAYLARTCTSPTMHARRRTTPAFAGVTEVRGRGDGVRWGGTAELHRHSCESRNPVRRSHPALS